MGCRDVQFMHIKTEALYHVYVFRYRCGSGLDTGFWSSALSKQSALENTNLFARILAIEGIGECLYWILFRFGTGDCCHK